MDVVRLLTPRARKRVFALGNTQFSIPSRSNTGFQLYRVSPAGDADLTISPVPQSDQGKDIVLENGEYCAELATKATSVLFAFPDVTHDESGYGWCLGIQGSWSVASPERFLRAFGLSVATVDVPLSADMVETWLISRIRQRVRGAVSKHSFVELQSKDALPAYWWQKHCNQWLEEHGIELAVTDVSWASDDAEAADAEASRLAELEKLEDERERQRKAELHEARQVAAYHDLKEKIAHDEQLSARDREHKLLVLEKRHRTELLKSELQIEQAQRAAEQASVKHALAMAQLRNDLSGVQEAKTQQAEMDSRHSEMMAILTSVSSSLDRLAELPDALLAKLADSDSRTAHVASERVTSPEFNIPANHLSILGFDATPQALIQELRNKAAADGHIVTLRKAELRTRDIGNAKVKALPINSSLQMEFESHRNGFVTLLNVGTSGAIYLHVPNYVTSVGAAHISADSTYNIPGPELLPWDAIGDYVEIGPPGWEHLALFVSDDPIVNENLVRRSSPESPLIQLTLNELAEFCELLHQLTSGRWSVGVCSFLVE